MRVARALPFALEVHALTCRCRRVVRSRSPGWELLAGTRRDCLHRTLARLCEGALPDRPGLADIRKGLEVGGSSPRGMSHKCLSPPIVRSDAFTHHVRKPQASTGAFMHVGGGTPTRLVGFQPCPLDRVQGRTSWWRCDSQVRRRATSAGTCKSRPGSDRQRRRPQSVARLGLEENVRLGRRRTSCLIQWLIENRYESGSDS